MADTLGARITTTMRNKLLPMVTDQILRSNVALTDFVTKAKKWSGDRVTFPVKYATNTTGTSFAGYQALSTSATLNRVKAQFDPSFVSMTSSLPGDEVMVSLNSGNEERIIDLVKVTLQSDAEDLADLCGTQFWSDGTGNGGLDILGLGALVDDGNSVTTYGGLSRSTYTGMAGTVTASGGTLSLAKMLTLYFNVTNGNQKPTVGYCPQAVFSLYNQLLLPQERFMVSSSDVRNGSTRGTGAQELFFEGFAIKPDQKAPSGVLEFLNGEYIDWYSLDPQKASVIFPGFEASNYMPDLVEGNDYTQSSLKGLGFGFTGWTRAQNAVAANGFHVFGGQLIGREPRFNGKLTGITSI
jgi:hypothetical protein